MVDFSAPNLCGASPDFNKLMSQFDSIKSELTAGLDVDASTLASTLNTSLTQLETDLRAMVPSLPTLPAVNFQAEVASLATLPTGSQAAIDKLAQLTTQFGSSLPDISSAIDSAISAVTAGGDVCGALPNLELPSGAEEAVEKAKNSIQATAPALEEAAQTFSEDTTIKEQEGTYGDRIARDELELLRIGVAPEQAKSIALLRERSRQLSIENARRAAEGRDEIARQRAELRALGINA